MSVLISANPRVQCKKCGRPATVRIRYAKLNLCSEHFTEYIEERVAKTIERYKMHSDLKKLLIGVSGGKDSMSLLYILSKLKSRYNIEIVCLHIDLGLNNYSEESKSIIIEASRELGIPCLIISLKDLIGYTLPELVEKSKRPPCSLCGMLKRYVLNLVGLEIGADAIALGHHLDDILSFALKDFLLQDLVDFSKMTPITPGIPGVAAKRIKPLYEVYESDLELYAKLKNIRVVGANCPFKYRDPITTSARKMLDELEEYAPGFKISLSRKLARNASRYVQGESIILCKYCGMPSSNGICGFCKLTMKVMGEPKGREAREKIRKLVDSSSFSN